MTTQTTHFRAGMVRALGSGDLRAATVLAECDRMDSEREFSDMVELYESGALAADPVIETVEDRADSFLRTLRELRALPVEHMASEDRRSMRALAPTGRDTW